MLTQFIYPLMIFLTPLFFTTLTPNFYATPKHLLLLLAVVSLLGNWLYQILVKRQLDLSTSPLRFGLLAFAIVLILNLLIHQEGILESIVGPGSLYLGLIIWTYFLTTHATEKLQAIIPKAFLASTGVLALHTLLQLTLIHRLTFLPILLQSMNFTLTGNPLTTFILITIGGILSLYLTLKTRTSSIKNIYTGLFMLHLIAFIVVGYLLLPGGQLAPTLLPLQASWVVALDALKSWTGFIFGVGLSGFSIFFKSVKPLFLNSTPYWNITPLSGSSELLHLVTTTGFTGLLAFLAIPFVAFKGSNPHGPLLLLATLSGLALVVSPGTVSLLLIFFTSLGALTLSPQKTHHLTTASSLGVAVLPLLAIALTGYYLYLFTFAELSIAKAQSALGQNDGKVVYEHSLKAISLLPQMTSYHLSYSQVNLSLAAALSQKPSLSDAEREQVATLVSQSIQSGRVATSLRPTDSTTWQNLGTLYRNLINVAQGADQFALASYAQAIALDPANPALRVEYGGLLYQLGQANTAQEEKNLLFTRAQSEFQTAITLKPDYPNAYYNMAMLLETTLDYQSAYQFMLKSISLLGPDNPDLPRATAQAETLKSKLPKTPSSTPIELEGDQPDPSLALPSPLPTPIEGGLIELDNQ